jgi:hypothetical protein
MLKKPRKSRITAHVIILVRAVSKSEFQRTLSSPPLTRKLQIENTRVLMNQSSISRPINKKRIRPNTTLRVSRTSKALRNWENEIKNLLCSNANGKTVMSSRKAVPSIGIERWERTRFPTQLHEDWELSIL